VANLYQQRITGEDLRLFAGVTSKLESFRFAAGFKKSE
jgi:hypothetical protein